jgi:hypothetical protein
MESEGRVVQSAPERGEPTPLTTRTGACSSVSTNRGPTSAIELALVLGKTQSAVRIQANKEGFVKIDGVRHIYTYESIGVKERRLLDAYRDVQLDRVKDKAVEDALGCRACAWSEMDLDDEERRRARERANFVIDVEAMRKARSHLNHEDCALRVARAAVSPDPNRDPLEEPRYRLLLVSGKGEGCALTWHNFRRWKTRWKPYRRHPLDDQQYWALADRYDTSRWKKPPAHSRPGDPRFWTHFKNLYETRSRVPLNVAYGAIVTLAAKHGWTDVPSPDQVRYWYDRKADRVAVEARRTGREYLYNIVAAPIRRDWKDVFANQCWTLDHHKFNVFVRIFDPHIEAWFAIRPWITQVLDAASFYEVANVINAEPNRDTIEEALRRAVERLRYCSVEWYFDNGKDFRSSGLASLREMIIDPERAASICRELGVKPRFALPHNPRAKLNECDFGIVETHFERLWSTYCGHDKEHFDALWPQLSRGPVAEIASGPRKGALINPDLVPTLAEFTAAYNNWRETQRHQMRSNGLVLNGETPAEKWRIGAPLACRPSLSDDQITLAFLRPVGKPQKVKPGGIVTYRPAGGKARDEIDYRSELLVPWLERDDRVLLKIDPRDLSHAYVFEMRDATSDGEPIWKLIKCDGPNGSVPSRVGMPALSARQHAAAIHRQQMKDQRRLERKIKGGEDAKAELELRREIETDMVGPHATPAEAGLVMAAIAGAATAKAMPDSKQGKLSELRARAKVAFDEAVTDERIKSLRNVED